jgi:hypothetical protein
MIQWAKGFADENSPTVALIGRANVLGEVFIPSNKTAAVNHDGQMSNKSKWGCD